MPVEGWTELLKPDLKKIAKTGFMKKGRPSESDGCCKAFFQSIMNAFKLQDFIDIQELISYSSNR